MNCATECIIASAFMGASAYMMLKEKSSKKYKKYWQKMSKEKQEKYIKIKKERLMIMLKASIFGIFASITFSKFKDIIFPSENAFNNSCINTLVFYAVQYMVYILHPKSDYMLNHVENNEQAKAWLAKYKYMQRRWHIGLILGVIGYFIVNYVVFKNILKV